MIPKYPIVSGRPTSTAPPSVCLIGSTPNQQSQLATSLGPWRSFHGHKNPLPSATSPSGPRPSVHLFGRSKFWLASWGLPDMSGPHGGEELR